MEKTITHDTINKSTELDTSMYAILPVDSTNIMIAPHTPLRFVIPVQTFSVIDSMLQIAMSDTAGLMAEDRVGHTTLKTLGEYRRQYLPVQRDKDTLIWVNCFCATSRFPNWRKEIVFTKDGGNCHFQVLINLTTLTYSSFLVNGEA